MYMISVHRCKKIIYSCFRWYVCTHVCLHISICVSLCMSLMCILSSINWCASRDIMDLFHIVIWTNSCRDSLPSEFSFWYNRPNTRQRSSPTGLNLLLFCTRNSIWPIVSGSAAKEDLRWESQHRIFYFSDRLDWIFYFSVEWLCLLTHFAWPTMSLQSPGQHKPTNKWIFICLLWHMVGLTFGRVNKWNLNE
jgi:hypothetical protein